MAYLVYLGNWEKEEGLSLGFGIYAYDAATGLLQHLESVMPEIAVGNVIYHKDQRVLYVANEIERLPEYQAGGGGRVLAVSVEDPYHPKLLSMQPSLAPLPCGLTTDADSRYLLVTNHATNQAITRSVRRSDGQYEISVEHDDASVVLFRLKEAGQLMPPCDVLTLHGSGPLKKQICAHPHSVTDAGDGKHFFVCDKGADRIWTILLEQKTGTISLTEPDGFQTPGGSMPRYGICIHAKKQLLVNYEGIPCVSLFSYDDEGRLTEKSRLRLLESDASRDSDPKTRPTQSDVRLHPDGHTIYSVVRGTDQIFVLELSQNGELTVKQVLPINEGVPPMPAMHGPRGICISPDARWLYLAYGGRGMVYRYRIKEDGSLTDGQEQKVGGFPANLTFVVG